MSYLLDKTNNASVKITVPDGTLDSSSTSLSLIGRAFVGWGEAINENFLALLENFADSTPPRNALVGQLWYDNSVAKLKYFDGSVFNTLAAFPPAAEGFLYNNSSNAVQWVAASSLSTTLSAAIFPTNNTGGLNAYLQRTSTGALTWVVGTSLLTDALPSGDGFLTKNANGSYSLTSASTIATKADLTAAAGVASAASAAAAATAAAAASAAAGASSAAATSFPAGGIIMWSGTTIPTGWALCNGLNGTPDLRNRFIVGSGNTYSTGTTGGSADAVVVSHSHNVTDPGHAHPESTNPIGQLGGAEGGGRDAVGVLASTTGSAVTGISISSSGVSGTGANLPPYYALAFIMKT
jgi:hypothetical protein